MPAETVGTVAAAQPRPVRATRSLFRISAAPVNSNGTTADPPHQQQFQVGASVYDLAHHGNCRGFGYITQAADPAPDSTARWSVKWENGQRTTAIKEQYLALPLISHLHRTPPTALEQPVLVVLGSHRGKTGATVRTVRGCNCSWVRGAVGG